MPVHPADLNQLFHCSDWRSHHAGIPTAKRLPQIIIENQHPPRNRGTIEKRVLADMSS